MNKKLVIGLASGLILSASALCFAASQSQSQPPHGPPPSFDEMDTNGDGQLTEDELRGPLADDFSQFDQDGSGGLTEDELPPPPGGGNQQGNQQRQ